MNVKARSPGCRTQFRSRFCVMILLSWLLLLTILFCMGNQCSQLLIHSNRVVSGSNYALPNCIIIGVRKGGTRALLEYINIHDRVHIAPFEAHFFDTNYHRGLPWYSRQMFLNANNNSNDLPNEKKLFVLAEKSPSYFITSNAPYRIQRMNPNIRLILILRNPIDRLISDYTQTSQNRKSKGMPQISLEKLIFKSRTRDIKVKQKMINISIYHYHLMKWLHHFDPSQIHIVDGDRIITDPYSEVLKVEQFLRLPSQIRPHNFVYNASKGFYCISRSVNDSSHPFCLSDSKGRKHIPIKDQTLKRLREFFQPHNERLFTILGRNFDW